MYGIWPENTLKTHSQIHLEQVQVQASVEETIDLTKPSTSQLPISKLLSTELSKITSDATLVHVSKMDIYKSQIFALPHQHQNRKK